MKTDKNIFICALLIVMMLACVSAVSAEDALDADLGADDAADDAVELSIDDAKESETLETGSSSGEILAADETVVTNDTFFNYFDENGVINKSISEKELKFSGEFSRLGIDTITIDTPITISAVNITLFNDIGFKIVSDNVKLTGFQVLKTVDGTAIDIKGANVTIDDVDIGIYNDGKNDTFAIRAIESDNLNLLNNLIVYSAGFDANTTNVYNQVIQVRDSNNVKIKRNDITARLPAVDVNYDYYGSIDSDYPLVIGIQNGENISLSENDISSDIRVSSGAYSTFDTIMIIGSKNLEIADNNITSTDMNGDNKSGYLYVIDLYAINGATISGNDVLVNIPGGATAKGSAYGMQLNGITTNMGIYGNNFTTKGNGYAYGIYVSDYNGAVDAEIIDNYFDITGYAGTGKSNLVTAMELSITNAVIADNYISTKMLNTYSDDLRVFGICYSSSNKRNHTYTIQNNLVVTEGKYAVFLMNVVDANVTENCLLAHEMYGDDAVYIDSGSNIVKDNLPPFTVTNDTFFYFFDENGVISSDFRELIFEGKFGGLGIDTITVDVPVTLYSENFTVFEDIGFKILSDNVTLKGFGIVKENDGAAIDIAAKDVTIDDVGIYINNLGKNDTFAIRAVGSDNLLLFNNTIYYFGNYDENSSSIYQHVVEIRDSNNVIIRKNYIDGTLPALDVAWVGVSGIDKDRPLVIGIQNGENIILAENEILADVKGSYGYYTTLDAIMIDGAKQVEITGNNITETDFNGEGKAGYLYAVDLYSFEDITISGNTILVNTTTGVEGSGAAYDIQATGPYTGFVVDSNVITALGNGPALGIYSADWGGPNVNVITNNVFDITGLAGSDRSALVSAVELQSTSSLVAANNITTKSIGEYNDTIRLFGISYAQDNINNHTFIISDNNVKTDGKYAVFLMNVVDAVVIDNTLYAHELNGDAAVYIDNGAHTVEDNLPTNVITNSTFFNYFDENGVIKHDIVATKLVFEGNFSDLGIDAITIDVPKTIVGEYNDTLFDNIGFKVLSDGVKLNNISIYMENGTAIDIKASDVTVDNAIIEVFSYGVADSSAIRAFESDGLNVLNTEILYLAKYDDNANVYYRALEICDSNNVNVENNVIYAGLPAIDVDYTKPAGISRDYPLVVAIQNGENITFAGNKVDAMALSANGYYPTLDSLMANNVKNLQINDNHFELGALTKGDIILCLNAVDLYNSTDVSVYQNDIQVITGTGIDAAGTAYPIQVSGPLAGLIIDQNNLTAYSHGPTLAIYAQNYNGPVDVSITNNVINVTGFASGEEWALLSGMELGADDVFIFGNDITVTNLNEYNDTNKAYGISYSQLTPGNHTFNIVENIVKVDGKYAVYLAESLNSTVTLNTLYGHDLLGDEAVNVVSGSAVVESNCPPFVITNETFHNFFDAKNYLYSHIPEGAILDFQGLFESNNYTVYINKPVNVISSTGDAVFAYTTDEGNAKNKANCIQFNIVEGADGTNVTGISIINGDLFVIGASNVTIDDVYMKANMSGIGASTGYISIHSNAFYTTVKNSYFENGGTGSSILVLGNGGKYATFDNNYFNITGSSGNVLSSNIYVGKGERPQCVNYTNNILDSHVPASDFMYGITACGGDNIIENNTILNFKGNAIITQYGADTANNVYRNNFITGGGSMSTGANSIIENNTLAQSALTVAAGCTATGNTAKSMSISGANTIVDNNTVGGAVTIAAAAKNTTFTNNHLKDALTVNSNDNVITDNQISTEKAYAVDLKSTSGNTVKHNDLSSKDKMGDDAVSFVEGKNNTVEQNGMNAIIEIEVADAWSGDNNTINITVVNATGTVTVKVNGKEYEAIPLKDGKAVFVVPAPDVEVGLNDVIVVYSGNENISADSKAASFYGLDNVVYTEVFFNYFDENGFLKDDVPYDDLIFKGAFAKSSTVKYIIIDSPVSIVGEGATLSQMAIIVASDNVTIGDLKFTTTVNNAAGSEFDQTAGALICVMGSNNVVLENLDINYRVTAGDHDAIAINVFASDDVAVCNNTIVFASTISSDDYNANAINLENVTNVWVENNTITTTLPGLLAENYDWDYFMMGLNTVNPVRIRNVTNITFLSNSIDSKLNKVGKTTPTIQCLFVVGATNATFSNNSFNMVDTISTQGSVIYLYAFNFGYCKNLIVSENDFYLSSNGGKDSAGAAYALQGVESEIWILKNNITTTTNGPNLGAYVASMMGGSSETVIVGNIINVTGSATSSSAWALVSGIEITNGNAYIYDNMIFVNNKAGYVDKAPVYGVSYAQYMYGDRSLDVDKNYMDVQGKYAVSVLEGTPVNVTNNVLFAEKWYGDRAVNAFDGIVENNTPMNPYLIFEYDNITVGEDAVFNITFDANNTGDASFVINGKVYEVNVTNGTGQVIVPGLGAGEYTAVAYLTEVYPYGPDEYEAVLTVARNPTAIEIDVAEVKAGEDAKVTINMGSATGSVIAIIDGDEQVLPIKRGKATTTIPAVSADLHNIVVIYNGDANYDAAYNTTSFYVLKNNSTVTINGTDVVVGEKSTINVTITENATGYVVVSVDDETFYTLEFTHTNAGSIAVAFDKAGNHTVSAVYSGDNIYDIAYSEEITIVVSEKEVTEANITTPVDFKIGEEANVTVSIPNATGNVTVIVDGIPTVVPLDENGTAVVPINVTPGEHSIVVAYSGDENHAPVLDSATFYAPVFESKFTNLTVSGDLVITGVLVDAFGDPIANATIAYTVGNKSGNLTTGNDGSFAVAGESNAVVSIVYDGTTDIVGSDFTIELGNIASARSATKFNVTDGLSIKTYAVDSSMGEVGANYKFQLTDSEGNPIVNATVRFAYKTVYFNRTTDENGCVNIGISTQFAGEYLCAICYLGDETHNATFVPFSFNIQKKSITISAAAKSYKASAKTKKYTVTLKTQKGVDGKTYLKKGKKVTLKINGKTYTAKTNAKGQATFKIKLTKKGKYTAKVSFAGDKTYESASKKVKITIK